MSKSISYKERLYWGTNWGSERKRMMETAKNYGFRLSLQIWRAGGNRKKVRKAIILGHPATVSTMNSKK